MYLAIKSLHVVAIISWMAGLLYLPRLFVYHSSVRPGAPESEIFKVMEYRLYKFIMNPAMVVSFVSGLYLVYSGLYVTDGWFLAKFFLVLLLTASHLVLGRHLREFQQDRRVKPERYFRILNEAPTLLMIGIVALVIVKPF